jgi:hypothetical protein
MEKKREVGFISHSFNSILSRNNIGFMSLEKQRFYTCSAWSDCSDKLKGDAVNNKALTIKPLAIF